MIKLTPREIDFRSFDYAAFREHQEAKTKLRAEEMRVLYQEQGATLEEIGQAYRVSRERVRQILKKNFNIGYKASPRIQWAQEAISEKAQGRIIARAERKGMTVEQLKRWERLNREERVAGFTHEASSEGRWQRLKANCIKAKMEFDLPRMEWLRLWLESGQHCNYGRGAGRYMTGRIDRTKGYVTGNVIIREHCANSQAARLYWGTHKDKKEET